MTARLLLAVGLLAVGCYDVPKPDCGFRCDSTTGCPDGYSCASDGRCHRDGADPGLVCPTPDAAVVSPQIVSSIPMAGQTIDPSTPLRVTFDVDVAGVSAESFTVVVRGSGMRVNGIVTYDGAAKTAAFVAPDGLPGTAQLDMFLTMAIYDPVTANVLMAQPIPFATSADVTSPQVSQIAPQNGETGVAVDRIPTLRFTEGVTNATATTITLVGPSGAVPCTVFYAATSHTADLVPDVQLAANTAYTVTASSAIVDGQGNPLVPFTSTFTTGDDLVRPRLQSAVPAPGSTNVAASTNIVVTFDEPVVNVTAQTFQVSGGVAGTITLSNGNRTATFDPTADLAPGAQGVTLTAGITDAAGNALVPVTIAFGVGP